MHIATLTRIGLLASAMILSPAMAAAQDSPEEQEARHALHKAQVARQTSELEAQKAAIAQEQAAQEKIYRDALAARDAEIAATRAKAAAERARWEAAVTACLAGDHSQCAQPATPAVTD